MQKTALKPHQKAWLEAHPQRSEAWLLERFADGFDVHHLDANRANNDPANLILVEMSDHMRLHGLGFDPVRALEARKRKVEDPALIYGLLASGVDLDAIAKATYIRGGRTSSRMVRAMSLAWTFAKDEGLEWRAAWNIPGIDPARKRVRRSAL